ncbi:DUF692 family multinuclear iron-containing protein [Kitasatospora sp. NPDC002040]|uniref:multinuclear nonheme iron-dependent oxidase n=1 Tax=Kitasatospora sp. NPDC002040 TaxID=3154661 RepID=UPI003323A2B8
MARLGVGLTYVRGLERLLEECGDRLDVIEVEPQTFWRSRPDGTVATDHEALRRLADLPGARLLHGVGNPVGGSVLPDAEHTALVGELAEQLAVPWVSEHLAFNRVGDAGGGGTGFRTGFMLPPRQTPAGVRRSVRSVRAMAEALPVPLAVELGTNYLRPRADELSDGAFAARVAEGADCGLLLDLHNVLANERNGRGSVDALLAELPLDRVLEVHLAGGFEHRGYWLDAHSGLPDEDLIRLAGRVLPRLPALRAVLFEVTASAAPGLEAGAVRELTDRLRELWPAAAVAAPAPLRRPDPAVPGAGPEEWEAALGGLAVGREPRTVLERELAADPAVGLLRELILEFRAGALAGTLVHTVRLLLLTLGEAGVRELIAEYARRRTPELFATEEAFAFAEHLRRCRPAVPLLPDVLELDLGLMLVRLDGEPRTVTVGTDPTVLLTELGAGRLPVDPPRGSYRLRLVDDRAEAGRPALSSS